MYKAIVCEIDAIKPHTNAFKLEIAVLLGDVQVVTGKGQHHAREIGVYFPSDGQLSKEFLLANNLYRVHPETNEPMGGYFEHNGRVRILKLRGEVSNGIWLPLKSLEFTGFDLSVLKVGDQFDELNGIKICQKYIPIVRNPKNGSAKEHRINEEKTYPFFEKIGDTEKLRYNLEKINIGDICYITEKIHGTSGRTGYVFKNSNSFFSRFLNLFGISIDTYELVTGTRRTLLINNPDAQSQKPRTEIHDLLERIKLYKGETLYYEIVGYYDLNSPIMPIHSTDKFPELKKKYPEGVTYKYNCINSQYDFYVYKITMTGHDGGVVTLSYDQMKKRCQQLGVKSTPVLGVVQFTTSNDLLKKIKEVDTQKHSYIDESHLMEGVIVNINGEYYKYKFDEFCLLEDIGKEKDIVDIEDEM